jgi:hypothetical protein
VDEGARASDAEREQFVRALERHCAEGRLTAEEFEERLEGVLKARGLGELYAITADLPELPVVDVPHRPLPRGPRRRRWRRG